MTDGAGIGARRGGQEQKWVFELLVCGPGCG